MAPSRKQKTDKPEIGSLDRALATLHGVVDGLSAQEPAASRYQVRRVRARLEAAARHIAEVAETLDTTRRPASIFDPSNPALIGRCIALTMIAQDRVALADLNRFYGSGVYAVYYNGSFPQYRPIAKTEHPLYVGKADPESLRANDAIEQGTKLWDRLNEHRKNIERTSNLNIEDFECRFLVVATGWQKAAEDYLIQLFRPIWNSEMGLVFGIGKHGDAASTRGNKRSPWDTLHPGRTWAADTVADQKPLSQIDEQLAKHFSTDKPYKDLQDIFSRFMDDMRQLPAASDPS